MKTKDTPKQYVIYSRKSKFTGKGESIENQIELCRQYITMHFGEEAAENVLVYEDEGFSGGNLERPQFKKMMKDSQKIAFAAIVVYRLDRISRNIGDFAKLIEDLGDRHIDFISIREQFDTSSPMGRAMMYIASVFSQLERETIAERIRDNMHELSKTGRWLGGTTPTGYASESESKITVDGKERKAYKLKPIPEEIQLVKTIFEVFMETGSLSKTDQYLLEHRCVTKRGKQFTRFAIRGILTNPVYMIADETAYQYLKENNVDLFAERSEFDGEHGVMAYNRTLQRPGKANQIRPMEEWIVAVGKHPGIIAGSDWVRVQAMLDVNKSKSYRKAKELLDGGIIGDIITFRTTMGNAGPENWSMEAGSTWFFDKQKAAMGALSDLGIHKVDLLQYLTGQKVIETTAKVMTLNKHTATGAPITVDDNALCILRMSGGAVGTLAASWTVYGHECQSTCLYGTKGIMLIYNNNNPAAPIEVRNLDGTSTTYNIPPETNSGVIDEFVAALEQNREPEVSGREALSTMRAIFGSIKSSEIGRTVSVNDSYVNHL